MAVIITPGSNVREDLTAAMWGFATRNANQFAGSLIFPEWKTTKRDVRYMRIPATEFLRRENTERAGTAKYGRSNHTRVPMIDYIPEMGWEEPIDPTDTQAYENMDAYEKVVTERVMGIVLRDLERKIANMVFNLTTFPLNNVTGHVAGTLWSSAAALPLTDVHLGHESIQIRSGLKANTLVLTSTALRDLSRNTNLIGRVGAIDTSVKNGILPLLSFQQLFDVERIIVVDAMFQNAPEGAAQSIARQWSNQYVWMGYVRTDDDMESPQAGRLLTWDHSPAPGVVGQSTEQVDGVDVFVEEYNDPSTSTRLIRARRFAQPHLADANCGYLIQVR